MEWFERLKEARLKAGLSQAEAAKAMGYKATASYQQYELGKRVPSLLLAARMCDIFNISLDWLACREVF